MQRTSQHTIEYLIEQERQNVVYFENMATKEKERAIPNIGMEEGYLNCAKIAEEIIEELKKQRDG